MKLLPILSVTAMVFSAPAFAQSATSQSSTSQSSASQSWQQVSQSGATSATSGGCADNVQTQIGNVQKQFIAGQDQLGNNGYTTDDFTDTSCLSNILGGLSFTLSPPNLSQILNQIENEVCNKAQQAEQNAISSIEQVAAQQVGLSGTGGSSSVTIPSYQLIPGVSTGATSGGIFVNPSNGYGGNPVSLNIAGGLDNSSYHSTSSFGSGLLQGLIP